MPRILVVLRHGLYAIADAYTRPREYARHQGFSQDQASLKGDVRRLGSDMRKVIQRREQQAYESPRQQ